MAVFIMKSGDSQLTIPSGTTAQVYGTNGVDTLNISQGANVALDSSFNDGIDFINIQAESKSFTVNSLGSTVILTDMAGKTISIPAGSASQKLNFADASPALIISGGQIMLGSQIVTSTPVPVTAGGGYTPINVSADIGTITTAATRDANGGSFNFTDSANTANNVIITNFSTDDKITVSNAIEGSYKFSNNGSDVTINFNNGKGILNKILLVDAINPDSIIYNEASFESAIGFNAFNYQTLPVDTIAPTLISKVPADNSTNVAVINNITLTFSENIKLGAGAIGVYDVATDTLVPAAVTVSGKILTINPTANLANGKAYYVNIATGAVEDLAGNDFAGITGETAFNFTTVSLDTTAPLLVSTAPADNSANVAVASNITLTFNENIKRGTGTIGVYDVATDMLVPAAVTVSGKVLTINPTADLAQGTAYYVNVNTGAITDLAGNKSTGITGETAFNFTTFSPIPIVTQVNFDETLGTYTALAGTAEDITISAAAWIKTLTITGFNPAEDKLIVDGTWADAQEFIDENIMGSLCFQVPADGSPHLLNPEFNEIILAGANIPASTTLIQAEAEGWIVFKQPPSIINFDETLGTYTAIAGTAEDITISAAAWNKTLTITGFNPAEDKLIIDGTWADAQEFIDPNIGGEAASFDVYDGSAYLLNPYDFNEIILAGANIPEGTTLFQAEADGWIVFI